MVGNITTHPKQDRQAGRANEQSMYSLMSMVKSNIQVLIAEPTLAQIIGILVKSYIGC